MKLIWHDILNIFIFLLIDYIKITSLLPLFLSSNLDIKYLVFNIGELLDF